ncbi:TetR/AcrR family transcriptional regulator [Metabacillus sp. KIGAM252]|uniref:TetR/AcrR family transcriptional regulator n=1 Tax=Metabacillus flavus TaxID=2823519 RepID=A0ABS5LDJ3_9BACI|nr:TetR/AcrR family transcriptional regulator [Metabacillus flavus]MBS2968792.1 TetR/AcrR family transcriptional regulator [Metabacillus flavus]
MKDREKVIINSAIKCFSQKGYHQTSIQEIADAAGVAKGSIYNYFGSKEDLLFSIFEHHFETLFEKMDELHEADGNLRESFEKQLSSIFFIYSTHNEFLHMQIREQIMKENSELFHYLKTVRLRLFAWYSERLEDVYGAKAKPFLYDLVVLLEGMVKEFLALMIKGKQAFPIPEMGPYLMKRMDYLIKSFMETGDHPLIQEEEAKIILSELKIAENKPKQRIGHLLSLWIDEIKEGEEKLKSALISLKDELNKSPINEIIVESLCMYIHQTENKAYLSFKNELDKWYRLYKKTN